MRVAEAAYQKQLEVNPLDKYAHAALSALYLERHEYEKAVPQLEKAVALNTGSAPLHIRLGKAHLNLKQDAQAIAAFDRAVELSPTPTTWNDIAYELSLKGVHLDRAQQYAESAVSSATAASRNFELERADDTALGVVRSLGAYWDTLGWVYYARGDMTRAERFVEAAWLLSQHAEVGDHLAQIYEKLGRRDDALRTYAQALAAERPAAEVRERLARLAGNTSKVDDLVKAHRAELAGARTIVLDATGPAGNADVFVLFSAASKIESVRYVSGDEALRPVVDAIRKATDARLFPDDAPAKILRRGVVACAPPGRCTLTLLLPDDTRAVK
jgi:tetratricopeptide (TPR) repeat protein